MTQETTTTRTYAVDGMSCGNCVRHIGEALTGAFGSKLTHSVDLARHRMTATFDPAQVSEDAIAAVMEEEGYPIKPVA